MTVRKLSSPHAGAQPKNRKRVYQKHGLTRVKGSVRARGLDAADKRTTAWKAVEEFPDSLIADLGGADNVSTQQAALVDLASRCWLYLNHIDGFLLQQERLVVGRGRKTTILPVLQQRQEIASHFESLMARLGLERKTKPLPSLQDYLERRDENSAPTPEPH